MTDSGKPKPRAKAAKARPGKAARAPAAGGGAQVRRQPPLDASALCPRAQDVDPVRIVGVLHVVTLRLTPSLKAELEAKARASGRTLSDVMRDRLSHDHTRLTETVRLLTSAIKARVGHAEIERLIEIHMESFKR